MAEIPRCSFCGKTLHEVKLMVAGPVKVVGFDGCAPVLGSVTFICDECVDICLDIIAGARDEEETQGACPEAGREEAEEPGVGEPLAGDPGVEPPAPVAESPEE